MCLISPCFFAAGNHKWEDSTSKNILIKLSESHKKL